jgi:hypothetical protein
VASAFLLCSALASVEDRKSHRQSTHHDVFTHLPQAARPNSSLAFPLFPPQLKIKTTTTARNAKHRIKGQENDHVNIYAATALCSYQWSCLCGGHWELGASWPSLTHTMRCALKSRHSLVDLVTSSTPRRNWEDAERESATERVVVLTFPLHGSRRQWVLECDCECVCSVHC